MKATKTVSIIARVAFKDSPIVVYRVRSSNGQAIYTTCLYNGKATGCDCAARRPCYHMTGCEALEQKRSEQLAVAATVAAELLPEMVANDDVEAHVVEDGLVDPCAGMSEAEQAAYWARWTRFDNIQQRGLRLASGRVYHFLEVA